MPSDGINLLARPLPQEMRHALPTMATLPSPLVLSALSAASFSAARTRAAASATRTMSAPVAALSAAKASTARTRAAAPAVRTMSAAIAALSAAKAYAARTRVVVTKSRDGGGTAFSITIAVPFSFASIMVISCLPSSCRVDASASCPLDSASAVTSAYQCPTASCLLVPLFPLASVCWLVVMSPLFAPPPPCISCHCAAASHVHPQPLSLFMPAGCCVESYRTAFPCHPRCPRHPVVIHFAVLIVVVVLIIVTVRIGRRTAMLQQ